MDKFAQHRYQIANTDIHTNTDIDTNIDTDIDTDTDAVDADTYVMKR